MSPAPVPLHQLVVTNLAVLLHPVCPSDARVLGAPVDWHISEHTVFEPDLVVVERFDPLVRYIEKTPLLAVEVLSPSTKLRDLGLKRRYYGDAGLPWYWIVDPEMPRLTVLRLENGRFVEHAVATGDQPYVATEPVEVTVVPGALVS